MKLLLSKSVRIAWTLVVFALCASTVVIWKLIQDAPPTNSVLIISDQATSAGGGKTPALNKAPSNSFRQATSAPGIELAASPTAATDQQVRTADLKINISPVSVTSTETIIAPTSSPEMIVVYVSGAVQKPSVYTLPVGSRVADAVGAAGGPAQGANLDNLNLAQRLSDEDHISVPHVGDTPLPVSIGQLPPATPRKKGTPRQTSTARRQENTPVSAAISQQTASPASREGTPNQTSPTQQLYTPASQSESVPIGKVNINTASEQELEALPGIGPSLAGKIVAYRTANGPFQAIEDIMRVPGIKEGIFSKLRDHITVGP